MSRRIVVCSTKEDLFEAAAQHIVQSLLPPSDPVSLLSLALSGGSTPRGLFNLLTADCLRSQVDWSFVRFFWGDERPVAPGHSDSNFRMAKEHLLDPLHISSNQVFRMEGERPPLEAAVHYRRVLQDAFLLGAMEVPRFNLMLLGMGPDAHTASLFPGTSVLNDETHLVEAPWVEKFQTHRLTLTPKVFNAAQKIMFVVSGLDKAQAAEMVLEGPYLPHHYPAQLIQPVQGELLWFLDQDAASQLKRTSVETWKKKEGE